jgi:hypothetical protein
MLPNKRARKQVEIPEPEEMTTIWYLFVNHANCPVGQINVSVVPASLSVAIFMQRLNEEHAMILPHFHYLTSDPWTYKDAAILSKPTAEEF